MQVSIFVSCDGASAGGGGGSKEVDGGETSGPIAPARGVVFILCHSPSNRQYRMPDLHILPQAKSSIPMARVRRLPCGTITRYSHPSVSHAKASHPLGRSRQGMGPPSVLYPEHCVGSRNVSAQLRLLIASYAHTTVQYHTSRRFGLR